MTSNRDSVTLNRQGDGALHRRGEETAESPPPRSSGSIPPRHTSATDTGIAYRDADLTNHPGNRERRFIIDAWLKSYKSAHSAGLIDAFSWYDVMIPQLDIIWKRPGVRTIVAHSVDAQPNDAAGLYGFICAEPDEPSMVYYAFVKEAYRRVGIARGLFETIGISPSSRFDYACKTAMLTFPTNLQTKIPYARWNVVGARYDRNNRRSNDR